MYSSMPYSAAQAIVEVRALIALWCTIYQHSCILQALLPWELVEELTSCGTDWSPHGRTGAVHLGAGGALHLHQLLPHWCAHAARTSRSPLTMLALRACGGLTAIHLHSARADFAHGAQHFFFFLLVSTWMSESLAPSSVVTHAHVELIYIPPTRASSIRFAHCLPRMLRCESTGVHTVLDHVHLFWPVCCFPDAFDPDGSDHGFR